MNKVLYLLMAALKTQIWDNSNALFYQLEDEFNLANAEIRNLLDAYETATGVTVDPKMPEGNYLSPVPMHILLCFFREAVTDIYQRVMGDPVAEMAYTRIIAFLVKVQYP